MTCAVCQHEIPATDVRVIYLNPVTTTIVIMDTYCSTMESIRLHKEALASLGVTP